MFRYKSKGYSQQITLTASKSFRSDGVRFEERDSVTYFLQPFQRLFTSFSFCVFVLLLQPLPWD